MFAFSSNDRTFRAFAGILNRDILFCSLAKVYPQAKVRKPVYHDQKNGLEVGLALYVSLFFHFCSRLKNRVQKSTFALYFGFILAKLNMYRVLCQIVPTSLSLSLSLLNQN